MWLNAYIIVPQPTSYENPETANHGPRSSQHADNSFKTKSALFQTLRTLSIVIVKLLENRIADLPQMSVCYSCSLNIRKYDFNSDIDTESVS